MKIHEAMSLYEITDTIQTRIAARSREKELSMRLADTPSAIPMLMQALRHAQNTPHGTTIVALAYKDGVIMAADRLATYGGGEVFSRTEIKLHNLETNAVVGICGMLAFAQHVIEDMEYLCQFISSQSKRPVSIPGKSNLLKQMIAANRDEFLYRLIGVSFGAILGGYDHISGPVILSFNTAGGVHRHECFVTDGSGYSQARDFLEEYFQYDMQPDEAIGLALGAIRKAGKFVTSVSHPLDDPPPTVKIISKNGISDVAEEAIARWILQTERKEMRRLFAKQNRHPRKTRTKTTPQPEGGSGHGA
jgi:proteasome beta subunit